MSEHGQRHNEVASLDLRVVVPSSLLLHDAVVENTLFDLYPRDEFLAVDEEARITDAVESLIEGGKSLLAVQYQIVGETRIRAVDAFKRSVRKYRGLNVADAKQTACWIALRNRDD